MTDAITILLLWLVTVASGYALGHMNGYLKGRADEIRHGRDFKP
jgi:hypothetical protein